MENEKTGKGQDSSNMDALAEVAQAIGMQSLDDNTYWSNTLSKEVVITKCKVKHIGLVLQLIARIMDEFGIRTLGQMPKVESDVVFFMKLLANLSDEVFTAAAALTNLSKDEFEELELDEAITILHSLYVLNKDFFFQSVLPVLQSALPNLEEMKKEVERSPQKKQEKHS